MSDAYFPQEKKIKQALVSSFHLRDNRVGTGGKGISVWVDVWDSKIEEEVGEKGPNALCQKHLEAKEQNKTLYLCCGAQEMSRSKI